MTLSSIIGIIIGIIIYNKFFKTEDDYRHIGLTHITFKEEPAPKPVQTTKQTNSGKPDIFGYMNCSAGSEFAYIGGDASDIVGMTHSIVPPYNDGYGIYETHCVESGSSFSTYQQTKKFVTYRPHCCRICGKPIEDEIAFRHPLTNGKIDTAILPDSELRYCDECKQMFREDKEAFYPFFLDFTHNRVVTVWDNRKEFYSVYLHQVVITSAIAWDLHDQTMTQTIYDKYNYIVDSALTHLTQTEYTKNADTAAIAMGLQYLR